MADYHSLLSQAVAGLDPNTHEARTVIYEKARRALIGRLLSMDPQLPDSEMEAQTSALETAIEKIEHDNKEAVAPRPKPFASTATPDASRPKRLAPAAATMGAPARGPRPQEPTGDAPERKRLPWLLLGVFLLAAILIGMAGYAYWSGRMVDASRTSPSPPQRAATPAAEDGELAPGVDGGSTEDGLSYVYRRQPVYYRTTHPVGAVIIDPLQRFLYLVQPNVVALRYGIGVGRECRDTAGLLRVARKEEWPAWIPSDELIKAKSYPSSTAGGPGNPLGARALYLDREARLIHGTNAPKSIGQALALGCFRLVNDDIVDLYGRVPLGTAVIIN